MDINTTENLYVVAQSDNESSRRQIMTRDFAIAQKHGQTLAEPKFYRSTVTIIKNIEEISEDDYYRALREDPNYDPYADPEDIPPF